MTYTCDVGYNATGGDMTRTCLVGGSWSGDSPECSRMSDFQLWLYEGGTFTLLLLQFYTEDINIDTCNCLKYKNMCFLFA